MQNHEARPVTTACVSFAELFQDRLLEEPPTSAAPAAERRRYAELVSQASEVCARCPLQQACLYAAVAEHDVSGFVAGTTQKQRAEIRRRLGVTVQPEDFDTLAGVTTPNRQVDHEEVVRLRNANPHETLENIAQRLGCSLSTVKRHLRRARADEDADADVTPIRRSRTTTPGAVLAVAMEVVRTMQSSQRAA